jgi:hypothetical protein
LSDQTPIRAPRSRPSARKPAASASTRSANSFHVHRTLWLRETSASRSPQRRTARSRLCPIVSPKSGASAVPQT